MEREKKRFSDGWKKIFKTPPRLHPIDDGLLVQTAN